MEYYDALETRDPDEREAALMAALPKQIAHAKDHAPSYAEILADVDPAAITGRAALAGLPVTRKDKLMALQADAPPFGGLAAVMPGAAAHLFASPGPVYEFDTARGDFWRCARALHAAGFRKGEILHNAFAYHLTPGGWILDGSARALGCAVCGSIKKALVSGGALFPALRSEYAERGVAVLQCYATADLGLIAYESPALEGMILDEGVIVEILRPGTGDPLPDGEVGEVVVTTLNPDYPLIRFATGDLSAMMAGASPCGRSNRRIKGWMGRADQTTKVKGMFVQPAQVAAVLKRHPEIAKARLEVSREGASDVMTLRCEVEGAPPGFADKVAESLQACCKLKGSVALAAPGELPNDGKVIDDLRSYD
jgi:phenylacetate-CoA ligase